MTKQADALETDVNLIVKRYATTHELPNDGKRPNYGDFTNVTDYLEAMNRVKDAQNQFDDLPPQVRKHVNNDPAQFLDMVYDPDRRGELEELGLVEQLAPESAPDANQPEPEPEPEPEAPAAQPEQ